MVEAPPAAAVPTSESTGWAREAPQRPPALADGVELLGPLPGSGYREPPGLVRRADGQTVQLTALLYAVAAAIDGHRSYEELSAAVSERIGKRADPADIRYLIEDKLRPLGILVGADGAQPVTEGPNPLLALRFRLVVANPAVTRRLTAPFAKLFLPVLVVPLVVGFLVSSWWVLFDKGLASATHQAFYSPGLLLTIFALTILSAGFHEFGHAAACRYGGATPGAMGFGLYLVAPAFYTDVSDAYRLDRRRRLWVDLGGLYFNAIFSLVLFGIWAATRWDAWLLVLATQILQMLRQLAPVIRADGYHIIADLTGVPDLFAHIGPTLRSVLPRRWRRGNSVSLKAWARVVVVGWVAVVVPALAATLVLGVVMFPRLVATAAASVDRQASQVGSGWAHGDIAGVLIHALGIVAVVLPVLGTGYVVVRLVRRTAVRVWRGTRGRPGRHLLAAAVAAAVLAAVAFAWWPRTQYRAVQPRERWTLTTLATGRAAHPATVAAAGVRQPAASAQPALLLLPRTVQGQLTAPVLVVLRSGDGQQQVLTVGRAGQPWPFPFAPPPAPKPGDNQAVAVNTVDGTAMYDVAFSMVVVSGQPVLNRNDAEAYASCRGCAAVAVAFQAVFIIGNDNVIVPVDTATAANVDCVHCRTSAVAVQLVASLRAVPGQDVVRQLDALWQQLDTLRAELPHLSSQQIYSRLQALKASMLDVLASSGSLLADASTPAVESTAAATPATSAQPSGTSAQTAQPSPASSPTASPATSSTPTPEPSAVEPSASPSS